MSEELEPLKPSASDSQREQQQQLAYHAPRNCGYCKAELSPHYYFCPRCATPYKPLETVLPALPQPYEDDEMRIRYKAPKGSYYVGEPFALDLEVVTPMEGGS